MISSPTFLLADQQADGHLAQILTEGRGLGFSYNTIAQELHTKGIATVTGETVRAWCRKLGIEKSPVTERVAS